MVVANIHGKVLDFWWEMPRSGQFPPRRQYLDPTVIPDALPYLVLIGFSSDRSALKYRLVGTAAVACLQRDPTGELLQPGAGLEGDLCQWSHQVMRDGDMVSGTSRFDAHTGVSQVTESGYHPATAKADVSLLLLPFSNADDEVDLVLAAFGLSDTPENPWYRSFSPDCRIAGQARRLSDLT